MKPKLDYHPSFWRIEAYTNGNQIVVLGDPPILEEDDPLSHNCDEMGCSSVEHVVARIPIMYPCPQLEWLRPERKEHGNGNS